MTTLPDLEPAAQRLATLLTGIRDDQLDATTPCAGISLGDLVDHVSALSLAFEAAARKDDSLNAPPPTPDAARLGDDWRTRVPAQLTALAAAWRDPAAWTGLAKAGGIEMPGEVCGLVALDEVVIHGWDVARASGQPFDVEPELLDAVHAFVAQFSGADQATLREGLFGPAVAVPEDAPLLDRVLGLTGRDPAWSAD